MQLNGDHLEAAALLVGVANLLLNLRLQIVSLRLRRYVDRLVLEHLSAYHGVKIPAEVHE